MLIRRHAAAAATSRAFRRHGATSLPGDSAKIDAIFVIFAARCRHIALIDAASPICSSLMIRLMPLTPLLFYGYAMITLR